MVYGMYVAGTGTYGYGPRGVRNLFLKSAIGSQKF